MSDTLSIQAPGNAQLLTGAEKAAELKVSIRTLTNWRKSGRVRFVKYSPRCIRYFRENL